MRLKLTILSLTLATLPAFAEDPTPASTTTAAPATTAVAATTSTTAANSNDDYKAPMNKYGAVNADANVPLSDQIIPAPANMIQPTITTEANIWGSAVLPAPTIDAKAYVLMVANNGKILAASNANTRLAPASLTKLMILYIVEKQLAAGSIHLDDQVVVPTVAWATGGSRMFLKPNQRVSIRDLISGVIVDSGNDAAVSLATYVAGTQDAFVAMMNQEAKNLNMTNTHFTDVMGLPAPGHYSTAYDLSLLARAIATQYPQYFSWYSQKSFTYNGITQANFNKLLFIYPYAQGMKTGSTSEAGYSLISAAQMPNNPMQLIGVVLGAEDGMASATASKAILTYGFHNYTSQLLYKAGEKVGSVQVNGGNPDTIPLTVAQDFYSTVPNSVVKQLHADLQIPNQVNASIKQGDKIGSIIVTANNQPVASAPAIAAADSAKATFWQNISNKISHWF